MKKLLAILLVLLMVLPMCVVSNAAGASDETQPFYLLNWEGKFIEDFNYVYEMPFFYTARKEGMTELKVSCYGTSDPALLAAELKEDFDSRPVGARYVKFLSPGAAIYSTTEHYVYMENMVKLVSEWLEEFLSEYARLGGKLDGLILDIEYLEGSSYYLSAHAKKDMMLYKKIVDHPSYKTILRPQLEERGFVFYPKVTNETPEIYSCDQASGSQYAQSRSIWNTVIRNTMAKYLTDAIMPNLTKYYPNANVCDYQTCNTYSWLKGMSDTGGVGTGGNYIAVGNTSNDNTYSSRPGTGFWKEDGAPIYKNIQGYNKVEFEANPFNMIVWDTNLFKDMLAAAPEGRVTAWVAPWCYTNRSDGYCRTPYYSEMFYHIGMINPTPFLGYIVKSEVESRGQDYDEALKVTDELLAELTRVAGAKNRKALTIPSNWNNNFIISGMNLGSKNIFRITPDVYGTGTTLESFKVAGAKDLTFAVNGQTITFPGGKIIEDSPISKVGTCGYWVETAADVMPVVTYPTDRYYQDPAYMESFEAYKEGQTFDFTTGLPAGCWEVKKNKDASCVIVADGADKAIAMKGTYNLKLANLPKNVTAGDTYAENQAWEVEVTVPANMAADAEIVALNIYTTKAKPEEGGFKINGGKVFYDNAGSYVELAGVDVSAGAKLLLKRVLNFTTKDAYTSSYYVYDEAGKLLAEAKDIPMAKVATPIQKIAFGVANVAGEAVLFDNFRLYTVGVHTDFELYNAKTGIEYTDLETTKNSNTAYRLSWQNASAYEKVFTVVAKYYNGETLVEEKVIKEYRMAPGTDAMDYGIVEVGEGQTVVVSLRNDSQPEPDAQTPGQEQSGTKKPAKTDNTMLIIVIAVAALLVAMVVVGIVLLTKKPAAKKEEAAEQTENTDEA